MGTQEQEIWSTARPYAGPHPGSRLKGTQEQEIWSTARPSRRSGAQPDRTLVLILGPGLKGTQEQEIWSTARPYAGSHASVRATLLHGRILNAGQGRYQKEGLAQSSGVIDHHPSMRRGSPITPGLVSQHLPAGSKATQHSEPCGHAWERAGTARTPTQP
ncbi:unnamed protein product [Gadus morhua 'NCC']